MGQIFRTWNDPWWAPHENHKIVYYLIWVASTFAVAVDEIDAKYAGAQDAKAHQESDTSMHADVDTGANVNTFLSIR